MDIFDHGTKKWATSIMLPEHIKMLKDLNVDYHREKKQLWMSKAGSRSTIRCT